jgi:nitrogen fixation protein FixH
MNWGKAIVVTYVLFGAFIISMVVMTYKQNIDLVAEDYYAQELDYQNHMHKMERLQAMGGLKIKREGNVLRIDFPEAFKEMAVSGRIDLYRPSNALFDWNQEFQLNGSHTYELDASKLLGGIWDLRIAFNGDETAYYHTEKLYW